MSRKYSLFYMAMNMEKNHDGIGSYRYERKFIVPFNSIHSIYKILSINNANFREIYQSRKINNLYLDTLNLLFFKQNVDGLNERKKIRIRWYGEFYGEIQPRLEIKKKLGLVSTKEVYNLSSLYLKKCTRIFDLTKVFDLQKIPSLIRQEINGLQPSLLNCYERRYFLSADNRFRVTIDYDLNFYNILNCIYTNSAHKHDDKSVILELKYDSIHDANAHLISNQLPFRLSRYSKYVNGINSILGC